MEWVAYFCFFMLMAAMNAKLLGACIVGAIGLTVVYPDETYAFGLCLFIALASLLASFRD